MASSLPRDAADPVAHLIHELESTRWRSDTLLRRAVAYADDIAPAVIAAVEQAADGVYLLPRQGNLVLWGIHILAAVRCTQLFRPLVSLVRRDREQYLEYLLGDVVTMTLPQILIAIFDGDSDLLTDAIADRTADGYIRWSLLEALAHLTFERRVPREATWALLDRFEREPLAEPGDAVWEGWVDAITQLGLADLFDSVRRVWDAGWIAPDMADRDLVEQRFAEALALPPGDSTMFVKYGRKSIGDPAEALAWVATEEEHQRSSHDKRPDKNDPAAAIALKDEEIGWLEGFLKSEKVQPNAMTLEQIDGLFCALVCGPEVPSNEFTPVIWNPDDDPDWNDGFTFDSAEQAAYVEALLQRHLGTIARRLERGHPHEIIVDFDTGELAGRFWAAGFLRGVSLRAKDWGAHSHPFIKEFLSGMVALGADEERLQESGIDIELRDRLTSSLGMNVLRLHHLWRGHDDPCPPPVSNRHLGRKIGRNEPCPCGSGKKFKFCCGSPTNNSLH